MKLFQSEEDISDLEGSNEEEQEQLYANAGAIEASDNNPLFPSVVPEQPKQLHFLLS